jgi:hypothetical protein
MAVRQRVAMFLDFHHTSAGLLTQHQPLHHSVLPSTTMHKIRFINRIYRLDNFRACG